MSDVKIAVTYSDASCFEKAKKIAEILAIPITDKKEGFDYGLHVTPFFLEIFSALHPKIKPLTIDFTCGKIAYRSTHPSSELLVKACRIKKLGTTSLLDVTAGLGRDSFILAHRGNDVTMIERSPVIALLLEDALTRYFQTQSKIKLKLLHTDARNYLLALKPEDFPDVIYLDPMFPVRTKSALVKKEMQFLQDIVGDDVDSDELFSIALTRAKYRVVVKRPRIASSLLNRKPTVVYSGKSCRFDAYITP